MTTTLTLQTPVEYQGKTFSELTFRAPRVKDLAAQEHATGEIGRLFAIIASITGVPYGALMEVEGDDIARVTAAATDVLGKSLLEQADVTVSH